MGCDRPASQPAPGGRGHTCKTVARSGCAGEHTGFTGLRTGNRAVELRTCCRRMQKRDSAAGPPSRSTHRDPCRHRGGFLTSLSHPASFRRPPTLSGSQALHAEHRRGNRSDRRTKSGAAFRRCPRSSATKTRGRRAPGRISRATIASVTRNFSRCQESKRSRGRQVPRSARRSLRQGIRGEGQVRGSLSVVAVRPSGVDGRVGRVVSEAALICRGAQTAQRAGHERHVPPGPAIMAAR